MNSNAKVQKEVAAAVGDVPLCIEAPFVRKHGKTQEDITNIKDDFAIFFSLRGDGAHYRDARAWNHTKMNKLPAPSLWFMQMLLLMAERTSDGSLRPHADRFSDPKGYMAAVELVARIKAQKEKPDDKKNMTKILKSDMYVDLRFLHEVEKRVVELNVVLPKVTNSNQAGMGKKGGPPALPAPAQLPLPEPRRVMHPGGGGPAWARNFSLFVTRDSELLQNVDATDSEWDSAFAPSADAAPLVAAAAAAAEGPYMGPEYLPKVDFTVTPVPDAEGEIMGIMVRFMVHDPALKAMDFLAKIIKNASERMANQMSSGGGGGRGGARKPGVSTELFTSYAGLYYSQHPVSNNTSMETYFDCAIRQCPDILSEPGVTRATLMSKLACYTNNVVENKLHLSRVLTMQRALQQALASGADPAKLGQLSQWTNGNGTARFPLLSYRYRPEQLFWKHNPMVGLMEQYFPHVDAGEDVTTYIITKKPLDRFLLPNGDINPNYQAEEEEDDKETEMEMRSAYDQIRLIIQDSTLVNRNDILSNRLVPYDTPNAYVHRAAEAEQVIKLIEQQRPTHYEQTQKDVLAIINGYKAGEHWRIIVMTRERDVELYLATTDLEGNPDAKRVMLMRRGLSLLERVTECERFNNILELMRTSRLKIFSTLWLVEGQVDDLPVPESLRAMMRWFRERRSAAQKDKQVLHLTRQFMMFDPELGIFGNSMLRQIKMFSCVGLILQPIICMLTEGLFSCFRYSPKKLAFNLLFHGRYDTGKSHAAINILMKLICIDGTVLPYVSQTKAADSTMRHYYDLIIASDEVPQRKVSQIEAEKDPDATNKDKLKLTDRSLGVNVFTYETDPNGEKVRWARTFRTDHFVALVEVTNHVVEATSALASRYFRLTVAQPRLEARKFQNDSHMSTMLHADVVGYMNTLQYLSACTYKAMQVGALREPHMGLFWDMSNCIIDYLQSVNALSKDTGARGLEIMLPYAIQMVIHNAIHCAFDIPGAPNYMKDFVSADIREVEPYLYCTVDIVWWCWTTLASGWIEEMSCNVIESAIRACGLDEWGSSADGVTPYEMYELDTGDRIPWRRRRNEKNDKDPLIDLQYITFYGNKEQVARKIAANSNPQLDWTDVAGVLNSLAGKLVPVPWDIYRPSPMSEMKAWHQFKQLPRQVVTVPATAHSREMRDTEPGLKDVPRPGHVFPKEFCFNNSKQDEQRTVKDMPRVGPGQRLPAVDMSDAGRGMIHIAPWVGEYFRSERVLEALHYATICAGTQPRKILTGMHLQGDQQNFKVIRYTQEAIEGAIIELDAQLGWGPDGKTPIPGQRKRPSQPSRRTGITFDRPSGMSKADSIYFNSVSAAPTNMSHEEWCSKSEADTSLMQQIRQTHYDLDFSSAQYQHCRIGQPLDAPVRTPQWVVEQFKRGCAAEGRPWTKDVDYPHETMEENEARHMQWSDSETVKAISTAMPSVAKLMAEAAKPRKRAAPPAEPLASAPATGGGGGVQPQRKLAKPTVKNNNSNAAQQALLKDLE